MSILKFARRVIGHKTYIVFLVVIAVASHLAWFMPGSILFHTDWLHWTDKAASQAWYTLGTWSNFFGFGQARIQIGFTVFQDLWSLLVNLGASFDTAVKIVTMVPIALLGFLSPYFAVRRLVRDNFIAFVAAIFYGTTTYFLLKQGSHLPIALVYALAPMIVMAFDRAYTAMRAKDWVVFVLVYSVGLWSEVRIMYIVTFVLGLYVLCFWPAREKLRRLPKALLIVVPLLFALNAFWLVPMAVGSGSSVIAETAGRALFGGFLFDLPHSLTLTGASWTGGMPDESFIMQPVPLYVWLVPLAILLPFALGAKLQKPLHRRFAFVFAIISVLGIFLTKQSVDPLPQAYGWLYAHFPGFSLFREASKLYLLTALGYMGLLALGLLAIKRQKYFLVVAAVPVVVAAINLWPLFTGGFDTLFTARHEPDGYQQVNEKIKATPDMTRSLWLPLDSQWAYFDTTHPKIGAAGVIQQEWAPFVTNAGPAAHSQLADLFSKGLAQDLVQAAAVKYVIVPARDIQNEDDFYRYYGDDRQFYTAMLSGVPWLKHIDTNTPGIDVYENTQDKPYISATDTLVGLSSLDDIEKQRDFVAANNLTPSFNFALNDKDARIKHSTEVRDVFNGLRAADVGQGEVTSSLAMNGSKPMLYVNTNRPSVAYEVQNNQLDLRVTQPGTLRVNGQAMPGTAPPATTKSVKLNTKLQYFVTVGDNVMPVDVTASGEQNIGRADAPVTILATDGNNLMPNPSFEQGLWQQRLKDCNPYDDNARIGMEQNADQFSDGAHSLRLNAANHTACTDAPPVAVTPGGSYLLNFDFMGEDADQVNYQVSFNDAAGTVVKKSAKVNDRSWHTLRQIVTAPKGATAMTLELQVMPHNLRRYNNATIFFDNVRLNQLTTVIDPKIDPSPRYQATALRPGTNGIAYADPAYSGQNLIPNPSLEDGLWQKSVGDCNAYDHAPQLNMDTSKEASDGKQSLELSARRHMACTGPGAVPVKQGASYLLSFDHQSPNTKDSVYHVSFDDPNNSASFTEDITVSSTWQTTTRIIKVPAGAHNLQLSVYAKAPEDGNRYTKVRYDNFKLTEIPDVTNQFFAVSSPAEPLIAPREISFTNVLPTKKLVHIKGASGSFFLTMAEDYDPQWRLEVNNDKVNGPLASLSPLAKPDVVADGEHIKWDNFTNGWYVDTAALCGQGHCNQNADGTYNIELMIEFTPERWFDVGVWLTALGFVGCIGFLAVRWLLDRRPPKPTLSPAGMNSAQLFTKTVPVPAKPRRTRIAPPLRVPPRKNTTPRLRPPKRPPRLIQL